MRVTSTALMEGVSIYSRKAPRCSTAAAVPHLSDTVTVPVPWVRVQGSLSVFLVVGFGFWGLWFGAWGLGFGVWGLRFVIKGLWFRVWGSRCSGALGSR